MVLAGTGRLLTFVIEKCEANDAPFLTFRRYKNYELIDFKISSGVAGALRLTISSPL